MRIFLFLFLTSSAALAQDRMEKNDFEPEHWDVKFDKPKIQVIPIWGTVNGSHKLGNSCRDSWHLVGSKKWWHNYRSAEGAKLMIDQGGETAGIAASSHSISAKGASKIVFYGAVRRPPGVSVKVTAKVGLNAYSRVGTSALGIGFSSASAAAGIGAPQGSANSSIQISGSAKENSMKLVPINNWSFGLMSKKDVSSKHGAIEMVRTIPAHEERDFVRTTFNFSRRVMASAKVTGGLFTGAIGHSVSEGYASTGIGRPYFDYEILSQ